jgi:DNA-binding winged helix-turn-helix (wHTH) protein/REP element-mobilizing transposase RayT
MQYRFANCEVETQLCVVQCGQSEHMLRPKAWHVLLYLLEHRTRVVSKQELAEQVWPEQFISDGVIENSILAARRAVGDSGRTQRIIQTLHGHGYRFIAPVTVVQDAAESASAPAQMEAPPSHRVLTSPLSTGLPSPADGRVDAAATMLDREVQQQRWPCYAYCLMSNHYHLLIETPEGNLVPGMRRLNGQYSQAFNRRHGRVGHVLQGRYTSIVVDRDPYLLELCRYIVLNPVRAQKTGSDWVF